MDQQAFSDMKKILTDRDNIRKIMPQVEEQIDHFLKVKLAKKMPMVSMFVGDKTINELKSVFMTELEEMLPAILTNYMDKLQSDPRASSGK